MNAPHQININYLNSMPIANRETVLQAKYSRYVGMSSIMNEHQP
jgi:hypothetical protein